MNRNPMRRSWTISSIDRKSTRLNSSHTVISYAVFCLKKKEHTSELQSHSDLVVRVLLEKKKLRDGRELGVGGSQDRSGVCRGVDDRLSMNGSRFQDV